MDKLVTAASLSLNNTRLADFDPRGKLAGIKGGPETEIQVFCSNVKVGPDGTTADSIRLVLPAIGDLEDTGTVNPDNV